MIGRACRICGRRITGSKYRCENCLTRSYRHQVACKVCGKLGTFGWCEEHYQENKAKQERIQSERVQRQPWRRAYSDPRYQRERAAALRRARNACERCGRKDLKLECDHVVPLSQGGANDRANLVILCVLCHRSKTAHDRRNR